MSDTLDPIRRRHAALAAARNGSQLYSANFNFTAHAEADIATLLAEVDRLREIVADVERIHELFSARIDGWAEAMQAHPEQPEMGPRPTLTEGMAAAFDELARLRERDEYLTRALQAIYDAHGNPDGGCHPGCSSWLEDYRVNDCDCGYCDASEDPAAFAASVLAGEAVVLVRDPEPEAAP